MDQRLVFGGREAGGAGGEGVENVEMSHRLRLDER